MIAYYDTVIRPPAPWKKAQKTGRLERFTDLDKLHLVNYGLVLDSSCSSCLKKWHSLQKWSKVTWE